MDWIKSFNETNEIIWRDKRSTSSRGKSEYVDSLNPQGGGTDLKRAQVQVDQGLGQKCTSPGLLGARFTAHIQSVRLLLPSTRLEGESCDTEMIRVYVANRRHSQPRGHVRYIQEREPRASKARPKGLDY